VRRRAAQARHAITGKPQERYGPWTSDPPYSLPPSVRARVPIVIHTARGDIELELFGDVAPYAVGTILDRASRGFYRNGTFHRVVSDFVIQGGCPRGDGWGGPGFTIPEETSPHPFVRGAAGIATNGRDTGGSQFFIMHARHPHLEGGYSVVGRVVSGIDVVDAIQQDDAVIDVEVKGAVR
jgi:cyclophilin family peptidyl-prolyl cis-trans isomerase